MMYFTDFDQDTLMCPNCESWHLHHDKIEVFERVEDAQQGTHVAVEGAHVSIDPHLKGNPSSRRHGLTVRFWCEECTAIIQLSVAQHKGVTLIDMEVIGEYDKHPYMEDEVYNEGLRDALAEEEYQRFLEVQS